MSANIAVMMNARCEKPWVHPSTVPRRRSSRHERHGQHRRGGVGQPLRGSRIVDRPSRRPPPPTSQARASGRPSRSCATPATVQRRAAPRLRGRSIRRAAAGCSACRSPSVLEPRERLLGRPRRAGVTRLRLGRVCRCGSAAASEQHGSGALRRRSSAVRRHGHQKHGGLVLKRQRDRITTARVTLNTRRGFATARAASASSDARRFCRGARGEKVEDAAEMQASASERDRQRTPCS